VTLPFGIASLGDWIAHPHTGLRVSEEQRFREMVDEGLIAERLGAASIHYGEHHFTDYVLSAPPILMMAVAAKTTRVRLSTAATLLPHLDAVRVAEDYATVDVLSGGRVELCGGRGVYQSHYEQFGQNYDNSEDMLLESVELLRKLWTESEVTWSGKYRPPLEGVDVHPKPLQRPHPPIWLSASSIASAERAVNARCPIIIPTVSTGPDLAGQIARHYRTCWRAAALPPEQGRVTLHLHNYVGDESTSRAIEFFEPFQHNYLRWVLREVRKYEGPLPPHMHDLGEPHSQAVVGSIDDNVTEINRRIDLCDGVDRLLVQTNHGGMLFADVEASYVRFARDVLPRLETRTPART